MTQRPVGSGEATLSIENDARAARLDTARRFGVDAARLCAARRCRNVRVLEVAQLSPVCDFFIIATAASARQMRTVARELEEHARGFDLRALRSTHREEPNERWVAIDLVDVIVHLFSEEARQFYDLDGLWGDAPEIQWAEARDANS